MKGLYYVRVREAVGRGKENGKSGGWVASCFWEGGGEGDDVFVDWVREGRGENWVSEVV